MDRSAAGGRRPWGASVLFLSSLLLLFSSSWSYRYAGSSNAFLPQPGMPSRPSLRAPREQQWTAPSSFVRPRAGRSVEMAEKTVGSGLLKNLQGFFKGPTTAETKARPLPSIKDVQEAMANRDMEALNRIMESPLPEHPGLKKGRLANGLRYAILRNAAPAGRFDSFLEIFAGSADELDSQQGMAHIVEHISYMGSRKRERLFGTGSQTNAFTDFHHTVYFACCPVDTLNLLGRPRPMLPMALDALSEVLEARFEESRLEKERAAILSEMSMVNTMDYRVECQILSALHAENKLALRFPIGKEELIRSWKLEDVKTFHRTHYRPDNAHLYIVGDVNVEQAEELIKKYFGHLESPPQPGLRQEVTLKRQSRHFPPVAHHFSGGRFDRFAVQSLPESLRTLGQDAPRKLTPRIFQHENIQAFSFHLFAKRPIEAVQTLADYRRSVMKRIAILALQIRLNVMARDDPPFTFIEFNQLDSAREACAVCNLDVLAEPDKWDKAVALAVREIRRLGFFGLSQSELNRYITAMLRDSTQHAAQGERISNSDQLNQLMESVACGHVFMEPQQQCDAVELVLKSITVEEVNAVAAEICEHLTLYGEPGCAPPSACVATCPAYVKERSSDDLVPFKISERDMLRVIEAAAAEPLAPNHKQDVEVPESLMPADRLAAAMAAHPPAWSGQGPQPALDPETGVHMKRLANGIRVNYKVSRAESHRGSMGLKVPGGRMLEGKLKPGSVAVGTRTMQEGGALGPWSREQVELFCVDNLMMVEINASEDWIFMDFTFPTKAPGDADSDYEDEESRLAALAGPGQVSGLESIFQLVHLILTDFKWEEDALMRAKKLYGQGHDMTVNSLEGAGAEEISKSMWSNDYRFLSIAREHIDSLSLDDVKSAVLEQMTTDSIEISIVGDFESQEVEDLALQYLGTIPPSKRPQPIAMMPLPDRTAEPEKRFIEVHLPDSNPRAFVYVSGRTPNRWGFMEGGKHLADHLAQLAPDADEATRLRRSHPGFPFVSLLLIQEIMNRRLFSNIRETKQLTYDANFRWHPYDLYEGGWYSVQIAASPNNAQQVLYACMETFEDLKTDSPISHDNLDSAKKVIINKHNNEAQANRYWTDLLSGIQLEACPSKDISFVRDFLPLVQSITVKDLQLVLSTIELDEDKICTCIAISEAPVPHPVPIA